MQSINKYITSFALGINSGLIYALLISTLTAYLQDSGASLVLIGVLSFRMFPYSFKPLWSSLVDNFRIKFFSKEFGQRKAWILISQSILIFCIISLGSIDTQRYMLTFFCLTFLAAFMGATSDIALEGYRIELFKKSKIEKGSSVNVLGFRVGLMISGALGLYMSSIYTWSTVFLYMGIFLIPGLIIIAFSTDNRIVEDRDRSITFRSWVKENFTQSIFTLIQSDKLIYMILLLGFFKVSDGYLDTLFIPFLMEMGFHKAEIASAKTIGIISALLGNFIGVKIISKIGMRWSLLSSEILAAMTNMLFIFLVYFKHSYILLHTVNILENFCSGIANIVLISYMSSLCNNIKFTASHYAILASLSMLFRVILSGSSGWVVVRTSWTQFFIISALLSLPSLICIYHMFFKNKRLA